MADKTPPEAFDPAALELHRPDLYSEFLLHSRTEILFVLRTLIQKGAMMTAYCDEGRAFLLTTLVAIDDENDRLVFDYGADEEMNRAALTAQKIVFTTQIDRVKIQFSLQRMQLIDWEKRPAFAAPLPKTLLRLQRREYFRLSIPLTAPVKCGVPVSRADGSIQPVEAQILDISGGGFGLMVMPDLKELFQIGTQFSECRINLPDEGPVLADIRVRSTFDVTTRSGGRYCRTGCEFVNLPGTRLTLIQRYITRIERERKARLTGMG